MAAVDVILDEGQAVAESLAGEVAELQHALMLKGSLLRSRVAQEVLPIGTTPVYAYDKPVDRRTRRALLRLEGLADRWFDLQVPDDAAP